MKKIVVLFLFLFFSLPCFAEYKPIPKELSAQYKADMEQRINIEVPKAKKTVDSIMIEAKSLHSRLLTNGYNDVDYSNLQLLSEVAIWGPAGNVDTALIKYSQKKYFGYKYKPITLADFYEYRDYLYKTFTENGISTQKISELLDYQSSQNKIIEKYILDLEKIIPIED